MLKLRLIILNKHKYNSVIKDKLNTSGLLRLKTVLEATNASTLNNTLLWHLLYKPILQSSNLGSAKTDYSAVFKSQHMYGIAVWRGTSRDSTYFRKMSDRISNRPPFSRQLQRNLQRTEISHSNSPPNSINNPLCSLRPNQTSKLHYKENPYYNRLPDNLRK